MPSLPESYRAVYLLGPEELEVRELPLTPPAPGELLLRIDAATTCGTDLKVFLRGGHPRMLQVPTPFGHECSGTIAAVGAGVDAWQVGQRVVVMNSAPCGRCSYCRRSRENLCRDLHYLNGAFAEYLVIPPRFVRRSTYELRGMIAAELAALTEPLACVLHGVDICRLTEPIDILVLGGGSIGLLFTQVLGSQGHRVTLLDRHSARRSLGERLGAWATADPVEELGSGAFELVIDATGTVPGWERSLVAVAPGGQVLLFGGCPPGSQWSLDTSRLHYDEITLRGAYHHRPVTVNHALELLAEGSSRVGELLTGTLPLEETAQALAAMQRREHLKVVLRP